MVFFLFLAVITIVLSFILSNIGFQAIHPTTGKTVTVVNLLSKQGFIKILTKATSNFAGFSALGLVLVCMLGVGVCDQSGLFSAALRRSVAGSKGSNTKIVLIFVFMAVMADAAGGTGFVVMPPLGAMVFMAMGKNPLTGMLCAYATVSGAFASNLLVTSMDVLNASFTIPAAQSVDPNFVSTPAMNYYFSACSAVILTLVSTFVTLKIVEPRLSRIHASKKFVGQEMEELNAYEKRALKLAMISGIIFLVLIALGTIPEGGILRDPATGTALTFKAPLMSSLTFLIALLFFIPGVVYGFASKRFKSSNDVANAMSQAMSDMGPFIALIFVASQFIYYFKWSNIGIILAIKGADVLKASGFPIAVVLVLFIIISCLINMLIGSASTKWAVLSPIFVPMFMFLGYNPALVQMTYRIGDAITNPITPGFAYFGMLLAMAQKYDKEAGFGTLMANMLPYTIFFFIFMTAQLLIWYFLKLPLGPGAGIML